MKEVFLLMHRDWLLEWRQRYTIQSIFLYLVSTVFICYLSFSYQQKQIDPITWSALLWIVLLFVNTYAVFRTFSNENSGLYYYYYQTSNAFHIITSKLIFGVFFSLIIALVGLFVFNFFLETAYFEVVHLALAVVLGSVTFAIILISTAAIASKTQNPGLITTILGFPLVIPVIMIGMKISLNAVGGVELFYSTNEFVQLGAFSIIASAVTIILYPYLWKS